MLNARRELGQSRCDIASSRGCCDAAILPCDRLAHQSGCNTRAVYGSPAPARGNKKRLNPLLCNSIHARKRMELWDATDGQETETSWQTHHDILYNTYIPYTTRATKTRPTPRPPTCAATFAERSSAGAAHLSTLLAAILALEGPVQHNSHGRRDPPLQRALQRAPSAPARTSA